MTNDILLYKHKKNEAGLVTKRIMLSRLSSLYDPLGLIGPIVFKGKVLFQQATRLKLSWDEQLNVQMSKQWEAWLESLQHLENLKFPRCVCPSEYVDGAAECCRLVLPYTAVHSIQQTKQIPNDPPQMGAKSTTTSNHPSTPGRPVFYYTGVDLFGPFLVKYGRGEVKRYGCLYTCLTTRAIHIEVLHSLETDTFLNSSVSVNMASSADTSRRTHRLQRWAKIKQPYDISCGHKNSVSKWGQN